MSPHRVAPPAKKKSLARIKVLRASLLSPIPWLVHGFSTRFAGFSSAHGNRTLNLGFTAEDARPAVEQNRKAYIAALLQDQGRRRLRSKIELITVRQTHSDIIHLVSEVPKMPLTGDGLITSTPGILLAVLTADCLPVILVDTKNGGVGVFHAGWRGTVKRIVEKGVGEMQKHFGSRPRDIKAAIGPGIRGCCYEVGPELVESFQSQFEYADELFREMKDRNEIHERYPLLFLTARAPGHSELPKKIFLDLAEANRRQLMDAGVTKKNIVDLGLCTACRVDLFFSHRAEKGKTGRMMATVGIRA